MIQFKTILLTTDLSENAQAAAPYALMLAEKFNTTIHLVYVFEDDTALLADGSMGFSPIAWLEHTETENKNRLNNLAASMSTSENGRIVIKAHYLRGNPLTELLNFARTHCVDCIVMATHGRTGLSRLFLGSVAEKIVRSSPCPVLTIKPIEIQKAGDGFRSHNDACEGSLEAATY